MDYANIIHHAIGIFIISWLCSIEWRARNWGARIEQQITAVRTSVANITWGVHACRNTNSMLVKKVDHLNFRINGVLQKVNRVQTRSYTTATNSSQGYTGWKV